MKISFPRWPPLRSATVILMGFAVIVLLLATLFALRLSTASREAHQLQTLRNEYLKKELIFRMRDSAHARALVLDQMTRTNDPAVRQALYASLGEFASSFISARQQLREMGLSPTQQIAWDRAKQIAADGRQAQDRAARLILANRLDAANRLLRDEVTPTQNAVMAELTKMLELSTQRVNDLLDLAKQEQTHTVRLAIVLSMAGLVIALLIAYVVVRAISRSEAALTHAREIAQTANRHKSIFLANMSHELRTPLNAILGYSEILLEDAHDAGQPAMVADLTKIQVAGHHLLGLINGILDLAKIEAGKMEIHCETFQVKDLIAEVASTVKPLLAKNGNELAMPDLSDLGQMHSDSTKLRQILLNLLSNASKFTTHGRITLAGTREQRDHREWFIFRVSDTGIGMNGDQVARLFQDFSQGDASTTRKYGGTGLGLSISKRFCKMLGGDLSAASEAGAGSVFTIALPAVIDHASAPAEPDNRPDALAA